MSLWVIASPSRLPLHAYLCCPAHEWMWSFFIFLPILSQGTYHAALCGASWHAPDQISCSLQTTGAHVPKQLTWNNPERRRTLRPKYVFVKSYSGVMLRHVYADKIEQGYEKSTKISGKKESWLPKAGLNFLDGLRCVSYKIQTCIGTSS